MATLAIGTGLAKIIGLLSIQILTRIYSPEHFGTLSVFTALLLILTPLMTLRYELAVPLPGTGGAAMTLMAVTTSVLLLMTIILGTLIWIAGPALLAWTSMQAITDYRALLVVALFLAGLHEMLQIWAVRRRAYPTIARSQLQQSIVGAIGKIGLGILGLMQAGLLVGHVMGASAGMLALFHALRIDLRRFGRQVTPRRGLIMQRHYRAFPVYRLPAQMLQIVASQSPLLLTAAIYDAGTTGQLGLALMTLALPMTLLGHTTSKAYYAEIASLGQAPGRGPCGHPRGNKTAPGAFACAGACADRIRRGPVRTRIWGSVDFGGRVSGDIGCLSVVPVCSCASLASAGAVRTPASVTDAERPAHLVDARVLQCRPSAWVVDNHSGSAVFGNPCNALLVQSGDFVSGDTARALGSGSLMLRLSSALTGGKHHAVVGKAPKPGALDGR